MSKLYNKYKNLKSKDPSKLYLFKSGIFYIFLDDDAIKMANLLNLKLVKLNETVLKCGFPVKNLDKYLNLIKINNYKIDIIDYIDAPSYSSQEYILNDAVKKFIQDISKIDYYHLSVSEAFTLIETITTQAQNLLK